MNICILDNSIGTTGAFNAILETIEPLRTEHNYFFILPLNSKLDATLKELDIQYCKIPMYEINRGFLNNIAYPFRLLKSTFIIRKIMKQQHSTILQVNDLYNLNGILLKLFLKFKLITHVRRMPESFPKILYSIWVRLHKIFSDVILPVSNANLKSFSKSKNAIVFYDPAPNSEITFDYNPSISQPIQLLYLANYMYGKGQNHALQVAKKLKEKGFNYTMSFYGDTGGNENNLTFLRSLKEDSETNELAANTKFNGPSKVVSEQIKEANIMLNFSDSESLSRITMEALYFGVPIIATNVGGTNEMIVDGWNGLLVETRNIEQMVEALEKLISSEEMRATFSKNGKEYLNGKFERKILSKQLNKIYYSLTN